MTMTLAEAHAAIDEIIVDGPPRSITKDEIRALLHGMLDGAVDELVSKSAIVDDLLTDDDEKVLAASQGYALKALIDALPTTADITAAIDALVGAAPGALNTLDELAAALADDASYAATITTALAGKQAAHANLTAIAGASAPGAKGLALLATADTAAALTALDIAGAIQTLLGSASLAAFKAALGLAIADVANLQSTLDGIIALSPSYPNLLINPDGRFNQRSGSSTASGIADGSYGGPDRWYRLTSGTSVSAARGTAGEDGTPYYQRMTQTDASSQRFGAAQLVEYRRAAHLIGQSVCANGRVRCSVSTNIKVAICAWSGTSDQPTKDLVNNWGSGAYAAGNFFPGSNLSVIDVDTLAVTANTWATLPTVSGQFPTGGKNLYYFVWTESAQAQNVTLDLGFQKLEPGLASTAWQHRGHGEELALCQRFYSKTFEWDVSPAQAGGTAGALWCTTSASSSFRCEWRYPQQMFTAPTVTTYNPTNANANWNDTNNAADKTVTVGTPNQVNVALTGASGVVNGLNGIHASASAEVGA